MIKKLIFLGDFFYDYEYEEEDILEIAKWIREQNASTIVNLEGPLSDSEEVIKKRGPRLFQSKISLELLNKLNVIGVSLSNNHIMDYGAFGLAETLRILDESGIQHTGAGMTLEEAVCPMVFEIGGQEYRFYSYGWWVEEVVIAREREAGAAPYSPKVIEKRVSQDIKENKKVVLLMHWGFENNLLPQPIDIEFAHRQIEAGVELIVGHHPHVIQPKEVFGGKHIYYSLGNFYFSSRRKTFKKQYDTSTPKESNYGLGVIWDTANNEFKEFEIFYDESKNKSIVNEQTTHRMLDLEKYDYKSCKYRQLLRKHKRNINPILTKDDAVNYVKLKMFNLLIRKVARSVYKYIKRK